MMGTVEMYVMIAVTVMTTTLGLPQACLHYCNFSLEHLPIPKGCDCDHHNLQRTRLTTAKHITTVPDIKHNGIFYDPVTPRYSQNNTFVNQTFHKLKINPIFKSVNATRDLISINTSKSMADKDSYDQGDSKASNKYKRTGSFPKLVEETKPLPLHIYLDIDVNNDAMTLIELKKMFENFQATEKSLSECINLHTYIFSKHNNTINKTNMNRGRKDQHDNLSSFQQLTEIESKCDQPASIIKQSIFEIKQSMSWEDKTNKIVQNEQDIIFTTDSYEDTLLAKNFTNVSRNINTTNMYLDTLTTHLIDDVYNNYNVTNKPIDNVPDKTKNMQFYKISSEHDDYNINLSDITSTSTAFEDSTVYNEKILEVTDRIDYKDLRTTNKTDRIVLDEKDIKIPQILTRELSNGTLMSVMNGYEKIPNSDFVINNSIISTHSDKSTNSKSEENIQSKTNIDLPNSIDKIDLSDIVNIHGNLYFSFGTKQIPARFIQQPDGKLEIAIDGFSMCDQMLKYNTSNFMNSLCKCIIYKNCS